MRASGYARARDDWYVEPRWAIDSLLDVEALQGVSWDPSCGGGNIPNAMRARGLTCLATDLVDRCYGEPHIDFLSLEFPVPAPSVDNVVTNPPYGIIEPYLEQALRQTRRKVCLLARLALLEGQARQSTLRTTPLARVWVSSRRMSMPPGGTRVPAKGGTIAYAWFVWEHGHNGPPTVGWI